MVDDNRILAVPVAARDILPWTKPGCRVCQGAGLVTYYPTPGSKPNRRLCTCGIKRFRKAQECTVVNGQLFAVEPWVAVHPETVEEAVAAMEKEQAEEAAKVDATKTQENTDEPPRDP